MKKLIAILVLMAIMGTVAAERIRPMTDILAINSDGEYITIFGPETFYFDGAGFENPVQYINGTAFIGDGK